MAKAFMKHSHAASAENTGLASHFHRSRAKFALHLALFFQELRALSAKKRRRAKSPIKALTPEEM
jgi:hypothetical protein